MWVREDDERVEDVGDTPCMFEILEDLCEGLVLLSGVAGYLQVAEGEDAA